MKKVVSGASSNTPAQVTSSSAGALKSDGLFAKITEEVNKNQAMAKSVGGVFLYNITDNGKIIKQWSKLNFLVI